MGNINLFLESSTIHGLSYIASTRRCVKLFWFLVVIAGFSGAGVLIHESFQTWDESPVKTTIETLPMIEITFPKVTVCPPKDTYTDLNYDIMRLENMTLSIDTRNELIKFALELLINKTHEETVQNLDELVENNRFYNWYNGLTKIDLPSSSTKYGLKLTVNTASTSGSISTEYFGERFDAAKVDRNIDYNVFILPNVNLITNQTNVNVTIHFDVEKRTDIDADLFKFCINLECDTTSEAIGNFSRNVTFALPFEGHQPYVRISLQSF